MPSSAPAYTIGGLTRPALNFDSTGHILLEGPVAEFAAQYGLQALYLGLPPGVPFPPIPCILGTPVDSNGAANAVAEGAAAGTQVGLTVSASHTALLPLTYSLTGDSSGGGFKIDPSTGVVTVADPSKIDFESSAGHAYTITARASDGIISTSQTFTIGVTDVAPSTPVDSNGAANTVAEGAAANTLVGITAAATDINGGAITWSLSADSSGGGFKINPTTGVISVADPTKIDYESTAPGHSYTVTARASDGTLSSSQSFTIGVTDVAPSAPTDSDPASNTVAEGAANGSTVGLTASSVDPNGPPTTYLLTNDAGGRFAIDSTTGVVTVANGAAIDYETAPGHSYSVTVQATAGLQTNTQTFAIGVADVAPSAPTDSNAATNTVLEMAANGTTVGITASSADPGGGPPATYSLTDSAGGRFAIDVNNGIVTVANGAAIDYETAPGPGHSYNITVQATAGALTSTQNFSIGVANVNEAPAGTDNTVTTLEDTPYVFTVADFGFTDPSDSSAPNSLLAVKMTTLPGAGTLTNNGIPVNAGDSISATDIAAGHLVFTPVSNANGSPEASFTFQVQDNGGTANGGVDLDQSANTLTINVTPVNDAPSFAVGADQTVLEDSGAFTINGFVTGISPGPADEAGQSVNFLASNDNNALFSVAPSIDASGNLTYTLAANANGSATVTVQAHDNGGTVNGGSDTSAAQTFKIDVTPVNDAPTFVVGGDQNVLEDSGAQTVNGFITAISPGPANESGQTVNFLVSNNNNALFSVQPTIDGNGNLSYTPAPDANGSATVTVMLHDNGGTANGGVDTSAAQTFTIQVPAVNDPPSFTIGANQVVLEDSGAHTVPGFITGISPGPVDESGQAVNFLVSSDNNALFSVAPTIDAAGNLTYTLAANANGGATVTVQAHDDGGTANGGVDTSAAQTFTVTATSVNDAPAGTATTLTILEDSSHTFTAAEFGFSDPVDAASASGPNAFQAVVITTTPGTAGTLTNNGVPLAAGNTVTVADINSGLFKFTPAANANGSPEASFTFQVQDNGGTANLGADTDPAPKTFAFNVTSVNDAPAGTDNTLSSQGAHTFVVSDFGFTDPNDTPSNNLLSVEITTLATTGTLTLNGTPVTAGQFVSVGDISSGLLVFTPAGNAAASFTFQVRDDGGVANGVDTDQSPNTFTINQDSPPTVTSGHTLNYTENQAATAIDPALTVTDSDNANLAHATVQITGNYVNGEDLLGFTNQNGITGSFSAATGTLTLTGSSSVANYQTALDSVTYFNSSENPSGAARTVTIITNDGTLDSTPATATINVTPVNDAPVVTAGHTLNYTENQAATALDPALTVTDVDSTNLTSATVQITGNYANGQDVLGFTTQNGITGSFTAANGTLTLTGSSSVANYQTALDSVTYINTSENPSGLARTVTIIANDGAANSIAKTDTINVTPVNDAPATTAGGTLNYTENQVPTAIDASVTVSDVDSTNLSSATVQITGGYVNGQDILGFTTQNGITGVFSAATGTMALSGSSSVANYQTALRSVTYFDNSDNPSGADRTVSYTANDGAANSNSSTSTIHVTPVNDAPVVTATGTLAYTENQAATAIAPALTVTDADTTTLTTATATISANYVNGEDVLAFTNTANITGSFNATNGTMTLTGTDTVANYQTALRSVTYVDTSENPSTAARTVTFTADDNQAANHLSAGSNHTITVASVNDAPVNNGVPTSFTVGAGFAHTVTGLSITDVDAGAANDITTTFTAGTGAVSIGNGTSGGTAGITGGATITTNASGTVVLTGTTTQINTSLSGNNVVYTAADGAGNTATTLQIATNDHGHTGTPGAITDTDTINVGVIPQVWFINQDQSTLDATATRGSQTNPFSTVTEFNTASLTATGPGANDYIYVKAGTYSGDGINLKAGQTLLGDDQALSFANPLGGPAIVIETASGARPTIAVTTASDQGIALASGNTVAGIVITTDAATETGIDDSGASVGTLNISDTDVTGVGQAINLTHGGTGGSVALGTVSSSGGTTGIALGGVLATSFSATGGTLSGHSVSEITLNGGSGTVSYAGTIGDGTGLSASITNRTGGTVTLSGNITDGADTGGGIGASNNTGGTIAFTGVTKTLNTGSGDAVSLTNNSGATINFTNGGLDIDTSSGTGFSASVAGTYSVTGSGNTINTTSGTALNLSHVTVGAGGVTFGSASTTSAATGISIDTVSGGAITISGGSITNAANRGVDINAASDDISIASSIASTAAGRSVEVTGSGKVGGNTISFSGAITDPGLGINLDNNDQNTNGATINFSGGLNINSTTHTGFAATNGGTVNVTNGANNSIITTTATALDVENTTIGSSNLTFQKISSSGGSATGIILDTTGAIGGLHVTGDGTTAGSGGTIASKTGLDGSTSTGIGLYLNNTNDVQLTYMNLHDFQNFGIRGVGVNGFTLTNCTVNTTSGSNGTNTGTPFNEGSVSFANLTGTSSITNSTISNGIGAGAQIVNTSGTLTLTVTGDTFSNNGIQGLLLTAGQNPGDTPIINANIATSSFSGNIARDIMVVANGGGAFNVNIGHQNVALSGGTFNSSAAASVDIAHNSTADSSFNIENATFIEVVAGVPINIFNGSASGASTVFQGRIVGNSINGLNNGGFDGITLTGSGPGTMTALVDTNIITNIAAVGINYGGAQNSATNHANLTITNNTITMPDASASFGIQVSGQASSTATSVVEATITGNNVINDTASPDYRVDSRFAGSTLQMPGYTGAATDLVAVKAFVAANNKTNGATTTASDVSASAGVGNVGHFTNTPGGAPTPLPGNSQPLLAAAGGVQASSPTPGETNLTQTELDSVVAAAIAQWAHAGATGAQLAALLAITFGVADLSDNTLGDESQGHVTIDKNAAGHGWFVDPTPSDNSEFTHAANAAGTDLFTDAANPAAGHIDLLTTVTHEMGHVLGLPDLTAPADDLMYINLVDGERRLPDVADVVQTGVVPASLPASMVVGTAGNDTINAGFGGKILFGGAGADNFVFGPDIHLAAPTAPAAQPLTHVADYSAAQGDTLDFSALTAAFHNWNISDASMVRVVEDHGGAFAMVQINTTPAAPMQRGVAAAAPHWTDVAQLDGAHSGDAVNVLVDSHGAAHLAHLHVDLLV